MSGLILHIGLPKTGTTFLQNWLHTNRTRLAAHGVHVPAHPIYAHRIAAQFIESDQRRKLSDVVTIQQTPYREALRSILDVPGTTRCTLLSSEYFWLDDPIALRHGLETEGLRVDKVIAYVRRQDRLMEAGYNQEVKGMNESSPLPPPHYSPIYDWPLLEQRWREGLPGSRVALRNYEVEAQEGILLKGFLSELGSELVEEVAEQRFVDVPRSNESLSAEMLEVKRLANMIGAPQLLDVLVEAQKAWGGGTRFRMSENHLRHCFDAYKESNQRLAELFPNQRFETFSSYEVWLSEQGEDFTGRLPAEFVVRLLKFLQEHK
ncbi:MAG TPA: hypothetical protein VGK56_09370 [Anaerolineales bacterium]